MVETRREGETSNPQASISVDTDDEGTEGAIGGFISGMLNIGTSESPNKRKTRASNISRAVISDSEDEMEVAPVGKNRKRKETPSPKKDDSPVQGKNKQKIIRATKSDIIDLDKYPDKTTSQDEGNISTGSTKKTGRKKIPIRDRLRPVVTEGEHHKIEGMTTEDLTRNLVEWMEDTEMIRVECSNGIQGRINGNVRERISAVIRGIGIIGNRVEERGDTAYLHSKQIELTTELKNVRKKLRN